MSLRSLDGVDLSGACPLTRELVARHEAETADLPWNPPREVMLAP